MTTPTRSFSYKLAQKRLAAPHSNYWGWVSLALALMYFGFALWDGGGTLNGFMVAWFLALALHEWVTKGLREVFTEQQQLLDEARALAGANPPLASTPPTKGSS